MWDDGDLDGREEVFTEGPALGVFPSESFVVLHVELVEEFSLFRPEPVTVQRVDDGLPLCRVAAGWDEVGGMGG